eukprot:6795696-Lingulodinium_polyedra.AAC.1
MERGPPTSKGRSVKSRTVLSSFLVPRKLKSHFFVSTGSGLETRKDGRRRHGLPNGDAGPSPR